MKSFEEAIKRYLDERAKNDEQFAVSYAKENKSIKECCEYIIGEVRKCGGNVVAKSDEEVYGLAVHYYDEDDIKVSKVATRDARVQAPKYEPTEEDLENAKKAALKRLEEEQLALLRTPKKKKISQETTSVQTSLFD